MATLTPSAASPYLGEAELRRGMELLYFGHSYITRSVDRTLAEQGLGRAHHRALYFIARKPNTTVGELLTLLAITKQSLGRVLNELIDRKLVETRPGDRDRRQRLLRLTEEGQRMESDLFENVRTRMAAAYQSAGTDAVTGYWAVLDGMLSDEGRDLLRQLQA